MIREKRTSGTREANGDLSCDDGGVVGNPITSTYSRSLEGYNRNSCEPLCTVLHASDGRS